MCLVSRDNASLCAQRRNAQSGGQNNAESSDSVFPSGEDLQGMNPRDKSDTVNALGWGGALGVGKGARGVEKGARARERSLTN